MDNGHFKALLEKYLDNSLSAPELRELLTLIRHPGNRDDALKAIERVLGKPGTLPPDEKRGDMLFRKIMEKAHEDESPAHRRGLYARFWIPAAAAAVIALSTVYFFYTQRKPIPQGRLATSATIKAAGDALPASHKATLTLADGTMVPLGEDSTGPIVRQGGTKVLVLNKGTLAYHASDNKGPVVYNTIATPRGGQYAVILPDGSRAWLNAGSTLRFPTAFQGKERTVLLTGEGYFEIAPDKDKPFTIEVNDMRVNVLGTSFDIHAYADESPVTTTLVDGRVRVTREQSSVVLRPGQQAALAGTAIKVQEADMDAVLAWKNGLFQFNSADMRTVMLELGRWYDVETHFTGKMPGWHFSGAIERNIPLSKVLKMLESDDVHFTIEDKKITVQERINK